MDIRSLFLVGIVQSLFLCVVIAVSGKRLAQSQGILIAWLTTLVLNFYFYWVSFSGDVFGLDFLVLCWGIEILQGPLIYLYTRSVLKPEIRLGLADLLHMTLYIIVMGLVFSFHYFTTNSVTVVDGYLIFKDGAPQILKVILSIVRIVTLCYIGASLYMVYVRTRSMTHYYSNPERMSLIWLRLFLVGIATGDLLLYLVIPDLLGLYTLSDFQVAGFSTIVGVMFTYIASYVNYRHQFELKTVINEGPQSVTQSDIKEIVNNMKYRNSGLSRAKALELSYDLIRYMEESKSYLNKNLTLRDVADDLDITPNTVSQVINDCMGKNFFEFINEYRIKEFKRNIKLGHHDNYTITAVAQECGFASKSTFYSTFKKITGQTPADFIRNQDTSISDTRLADLHS